MQRVFERIIDTLRTESRYAKHRFDFKSASVFNDAIKILNEAFENVNKGNISDGYHTFNELYHHRAVLFSVICNTHKEMAWKSKKHDTGDMYDGMFIVGIETPEGQATYHYDIKPYWDMFKVKELEKAPKWDGHTPQVAIDRIAKLSADAVEVVRCKDCKFWGIPHVNDIEKSHYCCRDNMWCMPLRFADDYCSYGKRKEE